MRKTTNQNHLYIILAILLWSITSFAGNVMTWVPPYYVPECKTRLQQDFGGIGMKDGLNYLALQFWVPNGPDVTYASRYSYGANDSEVAWFRNWANQNNVKVLLCVFNGENGWDWPLAKNSFANNRSAFVTSLVNEMERLGLDGIEVDLEGPGEGDGDKAAFMSFMQELSQAVRAKGKTLTIATFAYIWNAPNSNWWNDLVPLVDGITSMGYQEIGCDAGGWASYSTQKTLLTDPSKLMLGMPSDATNGGFWQGASALDQVQCAENLGEVGVAIWDCALLHNAWHDNNIWQSLSNIKGVAGPNYTITATSGVNGSISPEGVVSVTEGNSQTFSVVADAGYEVSGVTVDGAGQGAVTSYTFTNVSADHSIDAQFQKTVKSQYLIQSSAGANGSISPAGDIYVNAGNDQLFEITPNTGYEIEDVTIDGSSMGMIAAYNFADVDFDHTISAQFKQYLAGCDTVCASGTWSDKRWYNAGDRAVFNNNEYEAIKRNRRQQPDLYLGDSWQFLNDCNCEGGTTYSITASTTGDGIVSPAGQTIVNEAENLQYTINANAGSQLDYVIVDGVNIGAVPSYTFSTVTSDHTLEAYFSEITQQVTYTITANAGANGSISPNGTTTVNENDSKTFTIAANTGYEISDVTVDGISQGSVSSYTFNSVTANHTIAASFSEIVVPTYTISASAGANGSISPNGDIVIEELGTVSYSISADAGFEISDVTVDGISQGAVSSYTFNSVTENHTISATFSAVTVPTYTITASAGANGSISPAGDIMVSENGSQAFTVSADAGYEISDITVDGVSQGAVSSYTFNNVTANHTITAIFSAVTVPTYTISASAGANGSISPAGDIIVNENDSQTFTVSANSGYVISDVTVDGVSQGAISSYSFNSVTTNHTISATFSAQTSDGACDGVAEWDPNQNWTEYSTGDRRTNAGQLWECINPAYSFYEPSGTYGSYGWNYVGECQ